MNNISILQISNIIENSLKETIKTIRKISCKYKDEISALPFEIDILGEALHSKTLYETAHCRILYRLLQNKDVQESFIRHFLPNVDYSRGSIQIPYPDRNRIDLTIKSDSFFLIIENKVNGAEEQKKQIDRYVRIAQQTYSNDEIYILYLGGESNVLPTEFSMSFNTRQLVNDRIISKNYKDDIASWVVSIYNEIEFEAQPLLKSALLSYKTYLEKKYNLPNQYTEMNNKLDKALIEALGVESVSLEEKINIIEDEMDNIDKIQERLSEILEEYKMQLVSSWYERCIEDLADCDIVLTMNDGYEFGFNFQYRNVDFRCCVAFDDDKPYWGIKGITETSISHPKIFQTLQSLVLNSNKGFHNFENNPKEWVVSDYEPKEGIVERFKTLTRLVCASEYCSIE